MDLLNPRNLYEFIMHSFWMQLKIYICFVFIICQTFSRKIYVDASLISKFNM